MRPPDRAPTSMVVIEELDDDDDCCALEENPGENDDGDGESECVLEDEDGECVLEDEDGGCELELEEENGSAATGHDGMPRLEPNSASGDAEDDDDDEEEWEIPFAAAGAAVMPDTQTLDVRLMRVGDERLGLVLDASNVIVALREGTPAARSTELHVGDTVLAVQGVACSPERRVAQLLRELPDTAAYVFTVRRSLDASRNGSALHADVVDHGPLATPEEARIQGKKELEARQKLRQEVDALPADNKADLEQKQQLQKSLAPQNLTESKYLSSQQKMSPAAEKQMKDMWYRQARQEMERR